LEINHPLTQVSGFCAKRLQTLSIPSKRKRITPGLTAFKRARKSFSIPSSTCATRNSTAARYPAAHTAFPAHSSPLGLEYFDSSNDPALADSFLVALHGSTKRTLRRGYKVVKIMESASGAVEDFITGFFDGTKINGPADVFSFDKNAVLLTDDHAGVVYYVYRDAKAAR
jgi:glucose/arabinose dehydrogenase